MLKKEISNLISKQLSSFHEVDFLSKQCVYLKFVNPIGKGEWYVLKAKKIGNTIIFKGIVFYSQPRLQVFTLQELQTKKLPFGQKITWDRSFRMTKVYELDFMKNFPDELF